MIGIYKFTNKITGESYIGQSVNIQGRYNQHKNRHDKFGNQSYLLENTYFHDMLRHYGFHNFDFEVLEECNRDELNDKEIYYINLYNTLYPNGYNKTKGGNTPHTLALKDLDTVKEIQELLKTSKLSNIEIGEMYGVSDQTICDINSGRIWHENNIKYPIRNVRLINKKINKCKHCGKELKYKNKNMVCIDCFNKFYRINTCSGHRKPFKRQSKRPPKEDLFNLLKHTPFTQVGKIYGVTDNAVRKWCEIYNIPKHSSYYKSLRSA